MPRVHLKFNPIRAIKAAERERQKVATGKKCVKPPSPLARPCRKRRQSNQVQNQNVDQSMTCLELYRFRRRSVRSLILARRSQSSSRQAIHRAHRQSLASLNSRRQSKNSGDRSSQGKGHRQSLASPSSARRYQKSSHRSFHRARRHSLAGPIHPLPIR